MKNITLIYFIFIIFSLIIFGKQEKQEVDLFLYLKNGEFICEEKEIPKKDTFSFTAKNKEWINHTPLFSILVYFLHETFKLKSLIFLKYFLCLLSLFIISLKIFKISKNIYITLLLSLFGAVLLKDYLSIRPQIFTYLFFSLFVFLTYKEEFNKKIYFFYLPLITFFWVNIHSAFIIGILYLGLITFIKFFKSKNFSDIKNYIISILICGFISLLNPNTYEIYLYPLYIVGKTSATNLILEWQRPVLDISFIPFFLFSFFYLIVLLLRYKEIKLESLALTLPFLFLSLFSRRNIPFFTLIALPILGEYLRSIPFGKDKKVKNILFKEDKVIFKKSYIIFGTIIIFLMSLIFSYKTDAKRNIKMKYFPEDAVEFIKINKISNNLFHHLSWGNYIIYNLYPMQKTFIDSRIDVYEDRIYQDYKVIKEAKIGYKSLLEKYEIKVILIGTRDKISLILSKDKAWERIYIDPLATILIKKDKINYYIVKKYKELRLLYPETENGYFAKAVNYYKFGKINEAIKNLEEVLKINPNNQNARDNLNSLKRMISESRN